MQEVYFENIRSRIIPLLQAASNEVSIAMAWFTSAELFAELIKCLNRGVKVGLVLFDSPINFMEYAPDFNEFINAGGQLHIISPACGLMHHKFCVIDNSTAITGSYNWTYYAETFNIENILITNDAKITQLFKEEYKRLTEMTEKCRSAKRLSMMDIEAYDDISYYELNTEIESICKAHNIPVRTVFSTKTQVEIKELKATPVSRYDIGILVDEDEPSIFIEAGTPLPSTSQKNIFYLDSSKERVCPCKIVRIPAEDTSRCYLIKEEDIFKVANDTNNKQLKIEISMKLDDNGSLRCDITCNASNKHMKITALDGTLVSYDQQ